MMIGSSDETVRVDLHLHSRASGSAMMATCASRTRCLKSHTGWRSGLAWIS
jgi:hypothetical protein